MAQDTSKSQGDIEVFREMLPLMEEMMRPLGLLNDLKRLWPDLTEEQRLELESCSVYRDEYHKHLALECVRKLMPLARDISAYKNRALKEDVLHFLHNWQGQEADKLKVFISLMREQEEAARHGEG